MTKSKASSKNSFRKLKTLGQLERGKTPLVVHATEDWYEKLRAGEIDFFAKVADSAVHYGFKPMLVHSDSMVSRATLLTNHKQIILGVRRVNAPNILHAHPSYLWGFWYLDRKGYYWTSSLVDADFDADKIEPNKAEYFFNGVTGHMKRECVSKLPQPARGEVDLQPAGAAVFLQEIDNFKKPVHFLNSLDMIRYTALAINGLVYVKLHPKQADRTKKLVLQLCSELPNVVVADANVHDLIETSSVIVSQNSAVGFEALMYRKPVVTCGRIDYHHATLVARTVEELQECVQTAPQRLRNFPYEHYFYWFLAENMLEPQKEDFLDRFWTRIAEL